MSAGISTAAGTASEAAAKATETAYASLQEMMGNNTAMTLARSAMKAGMIAYVAITAMNTAKKYMDIRSNHVNQTKFGHNTGQRLERYN